MIHAQYQSTGGAGTGGVHRQGAWQVAVANGRYDVEVTVGEATPGTDPTRNVINLEGTNAIDYTTVTGGGTAQTGAARFKTVTTNVRVTDGFLTLDTLGGTNTKLTHLSVTPAADIDEKPDQPTGLTAVAGDGSVALDWADNDDGGERPPGLQRLPQRDHARRHHGYAAERAAAGRLGVHRHHGAERHDLQLRRRRRRRRRPDVDRLGGGVGHPRRRGHPRAGPPLQDELRRRDHRCRRRLRQGLRASRSPTPAATAGSAPPRSAPLNLVGNGRFRDVRAGVTVDIRQRGLMHMQGDDVPADLQRDRDRGRVGGGRARRHLQRHRQRRRPAGLVHRLVPGALLRQPAQRQRRGRRGDRRVPRPPPPTSSRPRPWSPRSPTAG